MNSWESDTTIIIPTYNERENIRALIQNIYVKHSNISILVVDDNSPDKTAEVVQELMKNYKQLFLLKREKKDGLGNAYKHAYAELLHDPYIERVITMDADDSHDPKYIADLLDAAHHHDLVVGSRYVAHGGVSNWSLRRKMMSKWGNAYTQMCTGSSIKDMTSGFICISKSLAQKIDIQTIASAGYSYQIEFKFRCMQNRAKIKEIPIIFSDRKEGQSKMSGSIVWEGIKTPLRLFWKRIVNWFAQSF